MSEKKRYVRTVFTESGQHLEYSDYPDFKRPNNRIYTENVTAICFIALVATTGCLIVKEVLLC